MAAQSRWGPRPTPSQSISSLGLCVLEWLDAFDLCHGLSLDVCIHILWQGFDDAATKAALWLLALHLTHRLWAILWVLACPLTMWVLAETVAHRCLAFLLACWLFACDFTRLWTVLTRTELIPLFLLACHKALWIIAGLAAKLLINFLGAACFALWRLTDR